MAECKGSLKRMRIKDIFQRCIILQRLLNEGNAMFLVKKKVTYNEMGSGIHEQETSNKLKMLALPKDLWSKSLLKAFLYYEPCPYIVLWHCATVYNSALFSYKQTHLFGEIISTNNYIIFCHETCIHGDHRVHSGKKDLHNVMHHRSVTHLMHKIHFT